MFTLESAASGGVPYDLYAGGAVSLTASLQDFGPLATSPLGLYYADYEAVYGSSVDVIVENLDPPVVGSYNGYLDITFAGIYHVSMTIDWVDDDTYT